MFLYDLYKIIFWLCFISFSWPLSYRIFHKNSEGQAWANIVEPANNVDSDQSTLFATYPAVSDRWWSCSDVKTSVDFCKNI